MLILNPTKKAYFKLAHFDFQAAQRSASRGRPKRGLSDLTGPVLLVNTVWAGAVFYNLGQPNGNAEIWKESIIE